jgi:hypothetical protein
LEEIYALNQFAPIEPQRVVERTLASDLDRISASAAERSKALTAAAAPAGIGGGRAMAPPFPSVLRS